MHCGNDCSGNPFCGEASKKIGTKSVCAAHGVVFFFIHYIIYPTVNLVLPFKNAFFFLKRKLKEKRDFYTFTLLKNKYVYS